jgi:hypothetical protein
MNQISKTMKEQDVTKMEFLLTVNDNIIVQRFFNVREFNPEAKSSVDFYNFIRDFKETLCQELKMKSVVYLLDNEHEIAENPEVLNTSYTNGPESFNIYIKINDTTICHRVFDAKLYPPKIRYTVDVRPHIKSLLSGLTEIFSSKNLDFQYMENVQLA